MTGRQSRALESGHRAQVFRVGVRSLVQDEGRGVFLTQLGIESGMSWSLYWPANRQGWAQLVLGQGVTCCVQVASTVCRTVVFLHSAPWWVRLSRGQRKFPGGQDPYLPTGGGSWVLAHWWAVPCLEACLQVAVGSGHLYSAVWWWVGLLVVWAEASQHCGQWLQSWN